MSLLKPPSREEILTGPPIATMVRIGAPAVASSILFTLYNLMDAFWIGRLPGEQALPVMAGIQVSWPFVWFLIALVGGFGGAAISALVAQNIGAGRPDEANQALNQLFTVGILAGFVLGIAGYVATPFVISQMIPNDPAVAREAAAYLRVIFLGLHTMLLPGMISYAFQATGDTLTPLVVNLIGVGCNMLLDPMLILGWNPLRALGGSGSLAQLNFPQMGIVGAAVATVIAQGIATLIFLGLFRRGRGPLRLDRSSLHPEWEWMKKALRIGVPAGLGQSSVAFGFMVMMMVIGRLDNAAAAMAGYGVADRIFGLLFIATDGLGIGLTTMIGQALGAQLKDRVAILTRKGIAALCAITVVEAAFLYFTRFSLVTVFLPGKAEAIREAARFIELFAAGMPFLSAFFSAQAIYRGSGHNLPAMILGIFRVWLFRIPLSWALAFRWGMGSDGIWLGMSLSNVLSGLASIGFLSTGGWQRSVIHEPKDEGQA